MKAAAQKRTSAGSSHSTGDQLAQAIQDRFLSRVFADGDQSGWLLKGGTGLLARVPTARRTQDLDLAGSSTDLDEAIADLTRRVNTELGDHLRFELSRTKETGQGDTQPEVQTRQVVFAVYAGRKKITEVKVDVVVGPPPTGTVDVLDPSTRLELARPIPTNPYRLYPLTDQIAEKICATMNPNYPGGAPSSRVKDLVDLVIIARTQTVDLRDLQLAIATHRIHSRIPAFDQLTVPNNWEPRYAALAAATPAAGDALDIKTAASLVNKLIAPALAAERITDLRAWLPGRGWVDGSRTAFVDERDPATLTEGDDAGGDGEVWVRPHLRDGQPVRGHWRSARDS
jgi:hypothetical protein